MSPALFDLIAWLVERLVVGSFLAAVLVPLAWLASRPRLRLPASMQTLLWWAVMLRIGLVFVPLPAVRLPILPANPPATVSAPAIPRDRTAAEPAVNVAVSAVAPVAPEVGSRDVLSTWIRIGLGGVWILGLAWHAGRLLVGRRQAQAVIGRAQPSGEDERLVRELAIALGLGSVPVVRMSRAIAAPQVLRVWRPVVLMPADASLSPDERRMAIGHELMHVRRHDLALGWVPALVERLFFFHPLVRLAAREYLTAREAACDAALVTALDLAPDDYGRLLVRFGVGGERFAWSVGGASPSASSLRRRLDMLLHLSVQSRRAGWAVMAAVFVALVPASVVARATLAPRSGASADVELSGLLPPVAHAILSQDAPATAPAAAPAVVPAPEREAGESERLVELLRQRLAAVEQALHDVELEKMQEALARAQVRFEDVAATVASGAPTEPASRGASDTVRRTIEEVQRAAAQTRELASPDARALEQLRDTQRSLMELQKATEAQARREAAQGVPPTDQSALRQEVLKQRLAQISERLRSLAEIQRELEREATQLQRELNAF
jgi:beta-lactamase regulating signal transducer with metallopeptidase domain